MRRGRRFSFGGLDGLTQGPEGDASATAEGQGPREQQTAAQPRKQHTVDLCSRPRLLDGGHDLAHTAHLVADDGNTLAAPAEVELGTQRRGLLRKARKRLEPPAQEVEDALNAVLCIGSKLLLLDDCEVVVKGCGRHIESADEQGLQRLPNPIEGEDAGGGPEAQRRLLEVPVLSSVRAPHRDHGEGSVLWGPRQLPVSALEIPETREQSRLRKVPVALDAGER